MDLGLGLEDDDIFDNCHKRTKEPCKDPYSARLCPELWFNAVDSSGLSNVDLQTIIKYRGDVAYQEEQFESALLAFQSCQDHIQPNNVTMRRGVEEDKARCHIRLGQPDAALDCARNVVALAQNFEQVTAVLVLLLDIYEVAGRVAEMLCNVKKLLLLHPNNSRLWFQLGDLYSSMSSCTMQTCNASCSSQTDCTQTNDVPVKMNGEIAATGNVGCFSVADILNQFKSMNCDLERQNEMPLQQRSRERDRLTICLMCFMAARLLLRSVHCRLNSFAKARNEEDQLKVESRLELLLTQSDLEEELQRCSEFLKVALNLTEADESMASTNKICDMTPHQVLCEHEQSMAAFDRKWFSWLKEDVTRSSNLNAI